MDVARGPRHSFSSASAATVEPAWKEEEAARGMEEGCALGEEGEGGAQRGREEECVLRARRQWG